MERIVFALAQLVRDCCEREQELRKEITGTGIDGLALVTIATPAVPAT